MVFIAAAMYNGVLPVTLPVPAPLTVTAWLFEWWFLWMLLPSLPVGTIIVLDNARVHRPEILRNMCQQFGMGLVYLPPYSPEYSFIEFIFSYLHTILRKDVQGSRANLVKAVVEALDAVPAHVITNMALHTGWKFY